MTREQMLAQAEQLEAEAKAAEVRSRAIENQVARTGGISVAARLTCLNHRRAAAAKRSLAAQLRARAAEMAS
jgi:hypothetical protein